MSKTKKDKLNERLNQLEEIVNGVDELSEEEKKLINTKIATIFDLHIRNIVNLKTG